MAARSVHRILNIATCEALVGGLSVGVNRYWTEALDHGA